MQIIYSSLLGGYVVLVAPKHKNITIKSMIATDINRLCAISKALSRLNLNK